MKHLLFLVLLSVVAHILRIGVDVFWQLVVLEGAVFTSTSEWLPRLTVAILLPVVFLYIAVGWLYSVKSRNSSSFNVLALACFVLFWNLLIGETIWYVEPSTADLFWFYLSKLAPSASVLLGWYFGRVEPNKSFKKDRPNRAAL